MLAFAVHICNCGNFYISRNLLCVFQLMSFRERLSGQVTWRGFTYSGVFAGLGGVVEWGVKTFCHVPLVTLCISLSIQSRTEFGECNQPGFLRQNVGGGEDLEMHQCSGAETVLSFTSAETSTHCLVLQCCVVLIYQPDRDRGGYLHKHGLTTSDYIMQIFSSLSMS